MKYIPKRGLFDDGRPFDSVEFENNVLLQTCSQHQLHCLELTEMYFPRIHCLN